VDDLDYLPPGARSPREAPYGEYADSRGQWPADQYDADQYRSDQYGANQYGGRPPADPYDRAYGWQQRGPGEQRPAPGYPRGGPRYGRPHPPPGSGPMPAYQLPGGMRGPGGIPGGVPGTAPAGSGPMPAYRPGVARGYGSPLAGSGLLAGYSPTSGPLPVYQPPPDPWPGGRRVLEWLPFGNRLVLLPKDSPSGAAEGEPREHRDVNGGWLRPAVFGAMDGLVTNSSLIAGIGGGGGGHGMIVLTGIAGLIAGAFSMATGEYISVKSQNELTLAEVELERKQHARDPEGKRTRLTQVYIDKGVSPNLAEAVVRQISANRDRAVATHLREELGIDQDDLPSARTAALASLASFTVGALLPLSPFLAGYPSLTAALAIAGASALAGGAVVARLTGRSMLQGGLRQFTAAFLATSMALLIGHVVGAHVG
jgi:vacuolar iron transporter family protein